MAWVSLSSWTSYTATRRRMWQMDSMSSMVLTIFIFTQGRRGITNFGTADSSIMDITKFYVSYYLICVFG